MALNLEKVDEEELSDERIEKLLQQAEQRLQLQISTSLTKKAVAISELPKLNISGLQRPYIQTKYQIAHVDSARLLDDKQRQLAGCVRKVEDPVFVRQKQLLEKKATAGPSWYNLPRTDLTPELKRDLQLLSMRSVLDPKRHYKKENGKTKPPQFSQVGTLIEGPTEFYSARIQNKDRKRTFVEEVMTTERETGRFRRTYDQIQEKKTSGKKGHYKALMAKRYGNKFKR